MLHSLVSKLKESLVSVLPITIMIIIIGLSTSSLRGYNFLSFAIGAVLLLSGTIINAKGTVAERAQSILGISVQSERELIFILAKKTIRNDIMTAIVNVAGLTKPGKGVVFSLPAEDVLGLGTPQESQEPTE